MKSLPITLLICSICFLVSCRQKHAPEVELSQDEILIRDAAPERVFQGVLVGRSTHLIVENCAVYEVSGNLTNKKISLVLEPESYPFFSYCKRQFLKAEKDAVVVWLGRMAFGADGCCVTGGTYRTTNGVTWEKISQDSSPY